MASGRKLPAIKQVVIYFSLYDETIDNKLLDQRFEYIKLDYSYDVLRVWELDKERNVYDFRTMERMVRRREKRRLKRRRIKR